MKRFASLRITAVLVAAVLVLALAACATDDMPTFDLFLITDVGTIDDRSFNQGSWEGLVAFAHANDITYMYLQPAGQTDAAFLDAVDLAVQSGARVIVAPGFLFEFAIYTAQERYPDVHFILIDGVPNDGNWGAPTGPNFHVAPNTVAVLYAEEEAGFLAGYAAVMDGFTRLGFMGGMAVPAVVRFGYGFLQGADYAALQLGIDDIVVNYHYTGAFVPSPEALTLAGSWFNDGVEVIFACGGGMGLSVFQAAEMAGGRVIGVDIDQSFESDTIITSALKGLSESVYYIISRFYQNTFPGGETLVMRAANHGVSLPMETSRFERFTVEQYEAIFQRLVRGEISIVPDTLPGPDGTPVTVTLDDVPLVVTTVIEF